MNEHCEDSMSCCLLASCELDAYKARIVDKGTGIWICVYRAFHNLASRLGLEKIRMWCYIRWMRCHMANNPNGGYLNFAADYFANGIRRMDKE